MASGNLSRIYSSTAFETALGTAQTLDRSFWIDSTVAPKHADELDDNVNGTIFPATYTRTALRCGGAISGPANSDIAAQFLKYLFMTVPTSAGVGPYTHTWIDVTAAGIGSTGQSFTLLHKISNIVGYVDRFAGCIVPSMRFTGSGKGKIEVSAVVDGSGVVADGTEPGAVNPTTENYFIGRKTTLTVGGVSRSARLISFDLGLNFGMALLDRAGSTNGEATSVDRTERPVVDLTYTLDEGEEDEAGGHDDYAAQTTRTIVLTLSGDTSRSVAFTLQNMRLVDEYPQKIKVHGIYPVTRKVQAVYVDSTLDFLQVVVTNGTASYP